MDVEEFRNAGKQLVDYVADYQENIHDRPVLPTVKPGYLQNLVPDHAPEEPKPWNEVFEDIDRVIMPGIASPACTELEVAVMNWLGKMLQLPEAFLSGGKGGGVIQGSASESTLIAVLTARNHIMSQKKRENPQLEDADIFRKLVAYTSDEAHASVERACRFGGVKCRFIPSDSEESMRGEDLANAIKEDKQEGLIPFIVVATLGTTSTCAFDNLLEIGPICNREGTWLHIDAAYAGSGFICPEFRHLLDGVEFADSFNFNPHKWLLVNFECSAMWFQESSHVVDAFKYSRDPIYLKQNHQLDGQFPDYRTVKLAHDFENLVKTDSRFEVTHKVTLGLVCFALKNRSNETTEKLLKAIHQDGQIFMVPSLSKDRYFIRFVICAARTKEEDIKFAWKIIQGKADKILNTSL